jgi:hypothetical protein
LKSGEGAGVGGLVVDVASVGSHAPVGVLLEFVDHSPLLLGGRHQGNALSLHDGGLLEYEVISLFHSIYYNNPKESLGL